MDAPKPDRPKPIPTPPAVPGIGSVGPAPSRKLPSPPPHPLSGIPTTWSLSKLEQSLRRVHYHLLGRECTLEEFKAFGSKLEVSTPSQASWKLPEGRQGGIWEATDRGSGARYRIGLAWTEPNRPDGGALLASIFAAS